MSGIVMKGRQYTLEGTIISYQNGIQAIKTNGEPKLVHCLGVTIIKCPRCKAQPFQMYGKMQRDVPCEHVREGTKVHLTYKVTKGKDGQPIAGNWVGKAYV